MMRTNRAALFLLFILVSFYCSGLFDKQEVKVEWTDVKEGTGAMLKLLKEGKVDLIIALTEGLISDIAQGSNVRPSAGGENNRLLPLSFLLSCC